MLPGIDRREENKKCCKKGQPALFLKLALDIPKYGEEGMRTSESEQDQTLGNYRQSFIT